MGTLPIVFLVASLILSDLVEIIKNNNSLHLITLFLIYWVYELFVYFGNYAFVGHIIRKYFLPVCSQATIINILVYILPASYTLSNVELTKMDHIIHLVFATCFILFHFYWLFQT